MIIVIGLRSHRSPKSPYFGLAPKMRPCGVESVDWMRSPIFICFSPLSSFETLCLHCAAGTRVTFVFRS